MPIPPELAGLSREKGSHDFGSISDQTPVSTEFVIKNDGATLFKVRDILIPCNCIQASLSSHTIAPRSSVILKVTYDPRARQGEDQKAITLLFDGLGSVSLAFHVRTFVKASASLEPRTINFGEIQRFSDVVARPMQLMKRGPEFKIVRYEIINPTTQLVDSRFQLELLGTDPAVDHGDAVLIQHLQLTFTPDAELGRAVRQVRLFTDIDSPKVITGNLMVSIIGPLQLVPDVIQLGSRAIGATIQVPIRIRKRNGDPFNVLSTTVVEDGGLGLTVSEMTQVPTMPGFLQCQLTGRVTEACKRPPGQPTPLARVLIKTDVESQPTIEVPIYLQVARIGAPAEFK
jgi:hypothetical protein